MQRIGIISSIPDWFQVFPPLTIERASNSDRRLAVGLVPQTRRNRWLEIIEMVDKRLEFEEACCISGVSTF
jgi:hypothetical protein